MGSITAIAGNLRSRSARSPDFDGPARVFDHAERAELLYGDRTANRDDLSYSLVARGRQQTLLARLVAAFEPNDANEIASLLLSTFGSLGQVLAAPGSAIRKVTSHSELAEVIQLAKSIVFEAMREDLRQSVFNPHAPNFNQFVIATLGNVRQEKMLAIFLDGHSRYICDEIVAQGGWSEVQLRPRVLLRRAIELDSARIVLCHNHPSGRAEPSKRDVEFTERLARCAGSLGIEIVDHLIVAGPRVCSMRAVGAMK